VSQIESLIHETSSIRSHGEARVEFQGLGEASNGLVWIAACSGFGVHGTGRLVQRGRSRSQSSLQGALLEHVGDGSDVRPDVIDRSDVVDGPDVDDGSDDVDGPDDRPDSG